MMKMLTIAAVLACMSSVAAAQTTTQQSVVGASGDAVYSLRVVGANGTTYDCRPDLVTQNGQTVRLCRRAGGAMTVDGVGRGGGATAGILGGLFAILAIGAASGSN